MALTLRYSLFAGLLLFLAGAAPSARADTTPPALTGIDVLPRTVAAGDPVTVHIAATDAGSGVNPAKLFVILLPPAGNGQITISNGWSLVAANTYGASATLPTYAALGAWQVYAVLIYDYAGNGRFYLNGRDYNQTFTVTNPQPDTSPPTLNGIGIAPDPANAGQPVTVTLALTDSPSGVNTGAITVVLRDPTGGDPHYVTNFTPLGNGQYQGEKTLNPFAAEGAWEVYGINVYDHAGNGIWYLNGRDYTRGFTVVNPRPDTAPPELLSVQVTPSPAYPGDTLTVTLGIRDDVSGVDFDNLFVNLAPRNGGAGFVHQARDWTPIGNDLHTGALVLSGGVPNGVWFVHSVFTRDLAGNIIHYLGDVDFTSEFLVGIPAAPAIFVQPLNVRTAPGQTATFSVAADGSPPLTYQWYRDGAPIPGAMSPNYTTPGLISGDNGSAYHCIVANGFGADTSTAAIVRFGLSDYQTILEGQAPDYWFRLDNALANSGAQPAPDLDRSGGLFAPDLQRFANLAFQFRNGNESLEQPLDIVGDTGSMTLLLRSPDAEITGFRHVFSQGNDSATADAFNLVFSKPDLTLKIGNANTKLITGQPATGTWYYLAFTWDMTRNAGEVLWWFGPVGGSLASGLLDVNDDAVIGNGTPLILGSNDKFSFGNFREETRPGTLDEPALWNRELAENEILAQFAAAAAPIGAPYVFRQPGDVAAKEGAFAYFAVEVVGDAPLGYQWQRDGIDLPGATGTVLSVGPVSAVADDGAGFRCRVSNPLGATTSRTATLTVTAPRDFQQTLAGQAPDYWFPLDASFANIGSAYAPALVASGGSFTNDNIEQADAAYAMIGGNNFLVQEQDIIPATGTMTLLFRTPDTPITGFRHVFGQGVETGATNAWNLVFANPDLSLKAGNVNLVLLNGQPEPGAWYFFSATWDESRNTGEVRWFFGRIGGSLASGLLDLNDAAVIGDGGRFYLGNKDTGFSALREVDFPGRVDELAVWSRELTDAEIIDQFITTAGPLGVPFILVQPEDRSGKDGENVLFSVEATGQAPLAYQWRRDGVPVPGGISSNLVVGPLTTNDQNAAYDVIISNALGVVTSATARVGVTPLTDYQVLLQGQAPDYWFRLDNSLVNRGTLPAPDLLTSGGAFADDLADNALYAYDIVAANGHLEQTADIIASTGSISFLFRTPSVPISGFRHLFAQSIDVGASNAFNIIFNNPNLSLRAGTQTVQLYAGTPPPDTWYYFGATWDETRDGGEVLWYFGPIGGTLDSGILNIGDTDRIGDGGPVYLGNRDAVTGSAWRMPNAPGTVDELAVWTRELTPADMQAQFQGAYPVLARIDGGSLVFRSSGTNAAPDGWTLDENGFLGCFVDVLASATAATRSAVFTLDLDGVGFGGQPPAGNLKVGPLASPLVVTGAGSYAFALDLPAGAHAVRIELTNSVPASPRSLTLHAVNLAGDGLTLVNDAEDETCLAAAETYIELARKGDMRILVVNSLGETQANAQVEIALTRHAFRFGVATSGLRSDRETPPESQLNWLSGTTADGDNYRAFVSNHFHAVGFRNAAKWNPHESVRDVNNLVLLDQLLGFAETNRMPVRIHTVGWDNDTFPPAWAYALFTNGLAGNAADAAAFREELSERMVYLVRDRAHRYDELDVINEDYHKTGYADLYGTNGLAAMYVEARTNAAFAGGRARTYVNEFNVFRNQNENGSYLLSYANWFRRHIEALEAAAGETIIDGIGVQGHVRTDAPARASTPYSIRRNLQTLLHLGVLGKPISITEFDVTDDDGSGGPLPDGEATNILLTAMTTFFGAPGVTTFMLWDFWEPAMDPEKIGVALVDASWNLTPAGQAFTNRMAEWTTMEGGAADAGGRFGFRGFYGEYRATVTAPGGNPTNLTFTLAPGVTSVILVAEGGAPVTNSYSQVIQSQNPDYWYRLNGTLANSGALASPDFVADNGGYGPDFDGTPNRAYQMIGGFDDLSLANDIIANTGSFSILFRTPDVPLAFRHVFAQGPDTATGDAFNLIHANPNLNFRVGNASATVFAGIPPVSTWYYLAATWDDTRDAGEVLWWFGPVGGALTEGVINMGNTNRVGNDGPFTLGNRDSAGAVAFRMPGAPGTLDELAVWTAELSPADITNQFRALTVGIGAAQPPPVPPPGMTAVSPSSGGVSLTWTENSGRPVAILWSSKLLSPHWRTADVIQATGAAIRWEDAGNPAQGRPAPADDPSPRFYRLEEAATP